MRRVNACALALAVLAVALAPARAQQSGGELVFPVTSDPPSYDGHQLDGADALSQIAPFYNTLLRVGPDDPGGTRPYPSIAERWSVSDDGKTYTFEIRGGVRFHDGSPLTARDVKATYDKIIFPPEGVTSIRKERYTVVETVEAPDASTVVFRLKRPSASFIASLLSPYNFIYEADLLARDPHWYESHVMGTGSFTLVEHIPGSYLLGRRNPDYWDKDKPYLDGFRAVLIRSAPAQVAALRSARAHILFAGVAPVERDNLRAVLGDKVRVRESPWNCMALVAINHEKKPFDDRRVRRALTLALDRQLASEALSAIAIVKSVAGVQVPGTPFATPPEELNKLAGYRADGRKSRTEARRLLRQAGIAEGFSFTLKNRGIPMPFEPLGVWLIDQWRRVGLNVSLDVTEPGAFSEVLRKGDYEVAMDLHCGCMVDPDLDLRKFLSSDRSRDNYGRYADRVLDELYDRQSRETDIEARRLIIRAFEKRLLDEQAHYLTTLQWQLIVPHAAKLEGWTATPGPCLNHTLDGIRLDP